MTAGVTVTTPNRCILARRPARPLSRHGKIGDISKRGRHAAIIPNFPRPNFTQFLHRPLSEIGLYWAKFGQFFCVDVSSDDFGCYMVGFWWMLEAVDFLGCKTNSVTSTAETHGNCIWAHHLKGFEIPNAFVTPDIRRKNTWPLYLGHPSRRFLNAI